MACNRRARVWSGGWTEGWPAIRAGLGLAILALAVFSAMPAGAKCRINVAGPSSDPGSDPGLAAGLVPAAFTAASPSGQVRVSFAGHSSFFIETPGGASVFTDYNGYVPWPRTPDIVTMSNTHGSHYTDTVEPGIKFVLRGWDPSGGIAKHDIKFKGLRVRNIPTNIAIFAGKPSNENSIFMFETARLCLVHLGNLRHVLGPSQLARLGQVDVLFTPIDGSSTLTYDEWLQVVRQLGPRLIIPMHYGFGDYVDDFAGFAAKHFAVKYHGATALLISRKSLPRRPVVLFLTPK